jgi:fructose-1,6-bisphosphatase-3
MAINPDELAYLSLLSREYPTIQATSTAIINLASQLALPKGTEHFVSDIHGEHEAFRHVVRSGSGSIRRRIGEIFNSTLSESERRNLATLIYYPEQRLSFIRPRLKDPAAWYRTTLQQLILICRVMASKYTRATVEGFLPQDLHAIIEELLQEQERNPDRVDYYDGLIQTIIETGNPEPFIVALADLIQKLAIARLHVIGDVFDRGPGAHHIMELLLNYHSVDIQWGNHDIVWMGAAAGSRTCIANVIRIGLRYSNLETLQTGYGISLLPLASFAMECYGDDPCVRFVPRPSEETLTERERQLMARMHKAIAIIQFKLEGQIIQRQPHYAMDDRLLLDKIDHARGTVGIAGTDYPLLDTRFPTVNPADPYALTPEETLVLDRLRLSFLNSQWLQSHVRFLFSRGSMYLAYNGNLLYHGCIPMNEDGSFHVLEVDGEQFSARSFMDRMDRLARQGYFATDPARKQEGLDTLWYLWSGAQSPLYGKEKMTTFERYFIADPATHREQRNAYYAFRDQEATARRIMEAFGLDPDQGHIINGHVPVKVSQGESPIKANRRLIVIDGGFSKAYQKQTGIAGYTLVYNSYGLLLAAHQPFDSAQKAIEEEQDMDSTTAILEQNTVRIRVRDTDQGQDIQRRIGELNALLEAYRAGFIKQR